MAVGFIVPRFHSITARPVHTPACLHAFVGLISVTMAEPVYDTLIIGGGPGGSTAASYLASRHKRVLLLEKEIFPRFHIGESLLPYNRAIFKEMGVLPALEKAGFTRKYGAQFHLGNASKSTFFVFRKGHFTREPEAFQVERARFDHILLQHAAKQGAQVREGCTVTRFDASPHGVQLTFRDLQGSIQTAHGRFLIDASGRGNLTGNQEGIREVNPQLKKIALFGHFKGVRLSEGEAAGDTVIVRLENKWFWLIPLSKEKVSVGLVMDREEYAAMKLAPEQVFEKVWRGSSAMVSRLAEASPLMAIQTTGDFSYKNRRFVGPRLLRVGDAAGFMDPIFSAGVYLAMYSGRKAAHVVHQALQTNDDGFHLLRQYERRLQRAMQWYWEMVENFYTTPFMELFMEPREKFRLASAVNAILAGELEGGWALRWRMRLFFWMVKWQQRWPLVPRITFGA